MEDEKIRIVTRDNKVVTLKNLFEEKERLRKKQSNLSFEKKIRALIVLQRIAHSWGEEKDLMVWKL